MKRPKLLALLGGLTLLAVVIGALVARGRDVAEGGHPDRRQATAMGISTSRGEPNSPWPESDRSKDGARSAAVAYATASQDWLYLADGDIERAVRAVATSAAGPSMAAETVSELRAAREALAATPGRVWWLVRPLASRVERFDPLSARVVVWTVTVLSAADVALPQADWTRVAVDLIWEAGGWRVQAVTETIGPTPMTGTKDRPWQPEALDEALEGFHRIGAEVVR